MSFRRNFKLHEFTLEALYDFMKKIQNIFLYTCKKCSFEKVLLQLVVYFGWANESFYMQRSGVEFPNRSPDAAPIFTPPVTRPASLPSCPRPSRRGYMLGYGWMGYPIVQTILVFLVLTSIVSKICSNFTLDSYFLLSPSTILKDLFLFNLSPLTPC